MLVYNRIEMVDLFRVIEINFAQENIFYPPVYSSLKLINILILGNAKDIRAARIDATITINATVEYLDT